MSLQNARRRQQYGTPSPNQFKQTKEADLYKLGSAKRPALLTVKSEDRQKALQAICDENGWQCEIEIDAEAEAEDIADLEELQNPPEPVKSEKVAGRNDPCPCGSGKKYKHCHGKR